MNHERLVPVSSAPDLNQLLPLRSYIAIICIVNYLCHNTSYIGHGCNIQMSISIGLVSIAQNHPYLYITHRELKSTALTISL